VGPDPEVFVDIASVQHSFDLVTRRSDEFAELFYRRLFADWPGVVPLFENVELAAQRKKLFATMTLVVSHLDRVDVVHPVLTELGKRHIGYGVTSDSYEAFTATFLEALAESLPSDWNRDLEASWRAALEQICEVMMASGRGKAAQGTDQAPSEELEVLMQISGRSETSGAHTRLFTSFLAKKVHDHDLEIARDVQRTLLPDALPSPEGYAIEALYEPAREVGGDYYDCIPLPDGRICVAFGDVAGKGVPAAIVMSRLASAMQTSVRLTADLAVAVATVNEHMCRRAWGGRFATLLGLILDPMRHTLQIVNAGHRAPLVRRADGRVEDLAPEITGVPVGILDDFEYEVAETRIAPGDVILLFTDGIDESRNPSGEFYGIERLRAFLGRAPGDAQALGASLLDEIHAFSAGRPPSDDIAILTLARLAPRA
jgi:serine phosphatase RsbU (regulator of sigma subunit)